jgi:hypothetical protein
VTAADPDPHAAIPEKAKTGIGENANSLPQPLPRSSRIFVFLFPNRGRNETQKADRMERPQWSSARSAYSSTGPHGFAGAVRLVCQLFVVRDDVTRSSSQRKCFVEVFLMPGESTIGTAQPACTALR